MTWTIARALGRPGPRLLFRLTAGIAVVGVLSGPAFAQRSGRINDRVVLASQVADGVAAIAYAMVRDVEAPTVKQYRVAALLLGLARQLTPTNDEFLRSEIEAWTYAGDRDEVIRATRELLVLDPLDTVAQLRLVTANVERLQDVDQRLAVYDRLLGPAGSKLDDSVRSRLALDAALLARETGDEATFLDHLTFAVTADVTNKDAAALYATYFLDRTDDPEERVDILANMVLSDPLDPRTHENLALELMRHGAFTGALRFFDRMGDLQRAAGIELTPEQRFDYLLSAWGAMGPARCLEYVRGHELSEQTKSDRELMNLARQGYNIEGQRQMVLLMPALELFRLAILSAREDSENAALSLQRVVVGYGVGLEQVQRAAQEGNQRAQAVLPQYQLRHDLDALWARMISGLELDKAVETLESLKARSEALAPAAIQRYEGWLAAHRGDTGRARELLKPLAERDENARFALALAMEKEGNRDEAALEYAKVASEKPKTILAAMARMKVERLLHRTLAPTPLVKRLNDKMLAMAPWLDEATTEPRRFMSLTVEHVNPRIDESGRIELRIRLRNELGVSAVPLAVGVGRPINTMLLLSPRVVTSVTEQARVMRPEVIRLDRRLRLRPGESIDATIWGGRWMVGRVIEGSAVQTTLRWRVVQGFTLNEAGGYDPGPMCLDTQSDILTRAPLDVPRDPGGLADRLSTAQGPELLRTVAGATIMLTATRIRIDQVHQALASEESPERRQQIEAFGAQAVQERQILISTLLHRMRTMSELELAHVLIRTRSGRIMAPEVSSQIMEIIGDRNSPYVLLPMILTGTREVQEAALGRMLAGPDPLGARLAALLSERARTTEPIIIEEAPILDEAPAPLPSAEPASNP